MKLLSILSIILLCYACNSDQPSQPLTLPSIENQLDNSPNSNVSSNAHSNQTVTSRQVSTRKQTTNINGKRKSTCTCELNGKEVSIDCDGSDCYCDVEGDEPKALCCEGADCPEDDVDMNPFGSGMESLFEPREPEIPALDDEDNSNQDREL